MNFKFEIEDDKRIKYRFFSDFYEDINIIINSSMGRWDINDLILINYSSSVLVFKGTSRNFGSIIIKVFQNKDEFIGEINALKCFGESIVCKLIDVDFDNKVLLEEAILPGTHLENEKGIKTRLNVFCDLYHQLHFQNNNVNLDCRLTDNYYFKSYEEWIYRITQFICEQDNWQEVSSHMIRAKELYIKLSKKYNEKRLLHGDFHYYNILKFEGGYKIIDPKGVIGDPIFDIPRYMLNEFFGAKNRQQVDDTMERVFDILSSNLSIPRKVLSEILYIEGTMGICWFVESGADVKEKIKYLNILDTLSMYMSKESKL